MADIGTAYVRIAPNMTGIQGKIAAGFKGSAGPATAALGDEVSRNSGPFQDAIGKLGGVAKVGGIAIASGLVAGAAGLAALTGKMLAAGGELEQQLGGSEAVFGEYAAGIQDAAEEAYFKAGLSQNEFLQGANKMGSLFQGAGFSVQDSMNMSADAMQRASDVASIMGIDTTTALEAVTGMAKGNFTMMDNLGVAMNDTAIQAYAVSKGITKSTAAMSAQEKIGLAQQLFMEKTAKYAGNYKKENQSLAGSINTTKKAFDNLLTGEGDIDGFMEMLINTIELAVPAIVKILPQIVQGIGAIISGLVPALSAALPVLLPALIGAVTGLLNSLVAAMPTVVGVLLGALPSFIDAFIKIFLAIVKALPQIIQILSNAVPQIVDALVNGLTSPETITAVIMGSIAMFMAIIKAIPTIISALVGALPRILQNIVSTLTSSRFISTVMSAATQLLMAIVRAVPNIIGSVAGAMGSILGTIGNVLSPGNLGRIGGDMIRGLWSGISNMAGWIGGKLQSFGQGVLDGIKSFFGIHSPSKEFALVGRDNVRGLAKGFLDNASLVTKAVNSVADDALSAMIDPSINSTVAFGATGGLTPVANGGGNNIKQDVKIGSITLGDASAVREMFKQLNQDTINLGMGMTPMQGSGAIS